MLNFSWQVRITVQYRSKVTWQSLETRYTRFNIFKPRISRQVSNELTAWLFSWRANPTNLPLLCAVAAILLKWLHCIVNQVWYTYLFCICKNYTSKHGFLVLHLNLCPTSLEMSHWLNLRKANPTTKPPLIIVPPFPVQATFSLDCDHHCK